MNQKKKVVKPANKKPSKTKKFYITTSIAYANAAPHLGYALECVEADAIARYKRMKGCDVFFGTGTDEHGDKIARIAAESQKSAKVFVNEISSKFKSLKKAYDLSYDSFIRTTDKKRHWPGVYRLWKLMEKSGDIYRREYEGLYCLGCEKFITEKDLTLGVCPLHGKAPEKVVEENYFFRLSRYGKKLDSLISSGKLKIVPEDKKNEMLSFIREGLEDISFSRSKKSVSWGIPVRMDNNPGGPVKDSDQVMYVWCDALTNYLTAVGYGTDKKKCDKWWPANIHLVGKDISRFHCILWPAMLMSAGIPLPRAVYVHGFMTADGKKMSKSTGNVVDAFEVFSKYGSDAARYYLLREIASDADGDFSWEKLANRYESDLAKGIGNFASRILNLASGMKFGADARPSIRVSAEIRRAEKMVEKHMDEFRIHEAVGSVWDLIGFGDAYINEKAPWKNKDQKVMTDLVILLSAVARLVSPFLPDASKKIFKCLPGKNGIVKPKKIAPLFPRIDQVK